MVPYTLSKRYQDSKNRTTAKAKAAALKKAKKLNSKEGDSDSDDGDEPVSFFSHLDESRPSSGTTSTTTYVPNVSNSHSSAWSDSSPHPQSSTALESYSSPSTSTYEITPTPLLANSAPLAPKPFRITEPNYDPITGIYSYGDSSSAPPETKHQGYEEPSEINQTGSTSSQPQPQAAGGSWEQYYHQAEQDQQLTPSAEYLEAYQQQQQEQQGQGHPSSQPAQVKPMPGTGPGLSIDDDVVRNYMIVL
jgi:hypothetical protein